MYFYNSHYTCLAHYKATLHKMVVSKLKSLAAFHIANNEASRIEPPVCPERTESTLACVVEELGRQLLYSSFNSDTRGLSLEFGGCGQIDTCGIWTRSLQGRFPARLEPKTAKQLMQKAT